MLIEELIIFFHIFSIANLTALSIFLDFFHEIMPNHILHILSKEAEMTKVMTPYQKKQIIKIIQETLGRLSLTKSQAQFLLDNSDHLQDELIYLVEDQMVDFTATSNQSRAREIIGKNFLGLGAVTEHFCSVSTKTQHMLERIPFNEKTLREYADSHVLVADVGLTIFELHEQFPIFFDQLKLDEREKYIKDSDTPQWRLVRKTPVEASVSKSWDGQRTLIDKRLEEIPSSRQIVYAIILCFFRTETSLFRHTYVRTSDKNAIGQDRKSVV